MGEDKGSMRAAALGIVGTTRFGNTHEEKSLHEEDFGDWLWGPGNGRIWSGCRVSSLGDDWLVPFAEVGNQERGEVVGRGRTRW